MVIRKEEGILPIEDELEILIWVVEHGILNKKLITKALVIIV